VVVDRDRCQGVGICESLAPDLFEVGDDGQMQLKVADIPDDRRAVCEQAVANCPTQSLTLQP
jgi:ferredoxin